ncbi:MAG: hypothetical protein ABIP75_09495 [Pyrinomonadaceae bacterium]
MIKMVIGDLIGSARERLRDRRGLLLLFGIYVGFLSSVALFVGTSVATIKQVLVTLAMVAVVPAVFFLLPAVCLSRKGNDSRGTALRSWWQLALASLPLLIVALIAFQLIGRIEASWAGPGGKSIIGFTMLRVALFGIAVPLALIQLWVSIVADKFPRSFAAVRDGFTRAFAVRPVLTYIIGMLVSGGLAYLLFIAKIPLQQEAAQVASVTVRVALGLVVIFFGVIVTLTAMSKALQVSVPVTRR